MRFDLLDEYSTLVPLGLGVSRKGAFQDPAVPAKATKRGTIAKFSSHLELLRKLLVALRQMVLSSYRKFGRRILMPLLSIRSRQSLTRLSVGLPLKGSLPGGARSPDSRPVAAKRAAAL